jgi:transposase
MYLKFGHVMQIWSCDVNKCIILDEIHIETPQVLRERCQVEYLFSYLLLHNNESYAMYSSTREGFGNE